VLIKGIVQMTIKKSMIKKEQTISINNKKKEENEKVSTCQ